MSERPLRRVVDVQYREVRVGLIGPDSSRRVRMWELELECGHSVERAGKYKSAAPGAPRANGWHPRARADLLPAPQRARCDYCRA